jgi:choline-sulfatase/uncharacterized sulfatase
MSSQGRPNILFLFSDQHNARCLSSAGHPDVKTPNLDGLASRGVRFTNAYANNPICTPSRISFLASLYPSTHGYYGLYGPEPQQRMTSLFEWFADHGYRTGALGKLHTPRYWIERNCQFVYDEFIEHPKYLDAVGLYEQNDNRAFSGNRDGETSDMPYEHACEAVLAKQTMRFIDNLGEPKDRGPAEAPWCGWVSFSRPHQPWTPSEPFASMIQPEAVTLPPTSADEKQRTRDQRGNLPEERLRKLTAAYLALVAQVDYAIGQILEGLQQRGQLENTIIVYASDHGDYAGEHGLVEKCGGISYRAICRVPLIVVDPRRPGRVQAGAVRDQPVESVDVLPTLCDLADLPTPDTVQGQSMLPLLGEDPRPIRQTALTENVHRKSLCDGRYRYVANHGIHGEPDELYDTQEDPWELNNRIDEPALAGVAQRMLRELLRRTVLARRPVTTLAGGWHNHPLDRDGRVQNTERLENTAGPYG